MRILVATMLAIALITPSAVARSDAVTDGEACRVANEHQEYDKAIELCTRSLEASGLADDQRAVALTNRAFAYRRLHDDDRALRDLDVAIQLWPDYLLAYWDRGRVRTAIGNYADAIDDYNKVGRSKDVGAQVGNVSNAAYYAARGDAYFLEGDLDRAITDYSTSISFMEYPTPFRQRGIAYFLKGDRRKAASDFAVDLDTYSTARIPTPPRAILWLALVQLAEHGDEGASIKKSIVGFDLGNWPGPIIRYYQHAITKGDVLKAVQAEPDDVGQAPNCDAAFYLGIFDLLTGRDGATTELKHASDTCPKLALEGSAARILLRER